MVKFLSDLNTPTVRRTALSLLGTSLIATFGVIAAPAQAALFLKEIHVTASATDVAIFSAIISSVLHRYVNVPPNKA